MIETLQSLRFVFIMLIVMSHVLGSVFDFGGECGVSFFFILSGFVLSVGNAEKIRQGLFKQSSFCLKQLLKFYPLHIATLSMAVLLDSHIGQGTEWYRLLPNILLMQSWIPKADFYFYANGPSWFLSDMIFFYLIFYLLFQQLSRLPLRCLTAGTICILIFYLIFAFIIPIDAVNSLLYVSPLARLIDFSLGILLYRFYVSMAGKALRSWLTMQSSFTITAIEISMGIGLILLFFFYRECPLALRCACLFWCFLPFFIYFFVETDKNGGLITRWFLQHPVMLWLGTISFEIYMIHLLLIRLGNSFWSEWNSTYCSCLFFLFIIIAFSWIVKKYFVDIIYSVLIRYVNK